MEASSDDDVEARKDTVKASLSAGIAIIRGYLRSCPTSPGVYRMINNRGDVLYVGKAKSLRKRVTSYTNPTRQSMRLLRMIAETVTMEFVTTHTEAEALLLEANLIKRYAPRYNILLRDDKSFPAILVTGDHDFARVLKHRGARSKKGTYFGPFAAAWAVNQTLTVLQRVFLLRSCADSVFDSRTRPCLLYQIKRCSAPCVGRIDKETYGGLVKQATAFLSNDSKAIKHEMAQHMQTASDDLDYERAAHFRDRIRALSSIQARQDINLSGIDSADVIAAHQIEGQTCIQVFFYRSGRNYGNRAYYPANTRDADIAEVIEAFVGQFYENKDTPKEILVSHALANKGLLAEALAVRGGRKVRVLAPRRGQRRTLIDLALTNAREALGRKMAESGSQRRLLDGIATVFDVDGLIERIEVYDNSHISGRDAIGAMIVAGPEGFTKAAYRKFNIRGIVAAAVGNGDMSLGDDYAMMREVLSRRFARALKEDPGRARGLWPNLIVIDGGAGHLGVATCVLEELDIDDVSVIAIAKGPDRNAGREVFFLPGREAFSLEARDPVLYFLQRLRDEAHRYAIGAHRAKRGKSLSRSALDDIPGVGAGRKKALLHHFGSARAVAQAGRADLLTVAGISAAMADKIYDWYHLNG